MPNIAGTLNQAINPQTFSPQLNVTIGGVYNVTLAPGIVAPAVVGTLVLANSGLGLRVNDFVRVSFQGAQTAGIVLADSYVTANDTLNVQFANISAGNAQPVSGVYDVLVLRPDTSIGQVNPAIQP